MNSNAVCECPTCGKEYFDYVSTCSVCGNEKIVVLRPFVVSAKTVETVECKIESTHAIDWKGFADSVSSVSRDAWRSLAGNPRLSVPAILLGILAFAASGGIMGGMVLCGIFKILRAIAAGQSDGLTPVSVFDASFLVPPLGVWLTFVGVVVLIAIAEVAWSVPIWGVFDVAVVLSFTVQVLYRISSGEGPMSAIRQVFHETLSGRRWRQLVMQVFAVSLVAGLAYLHWSIPLLLILPLVSFLAASCRNKEREVEL